MNEKYIFLHTIDDIQKKMLGDEYQLIRACGLLRQLFLDERPLLHVINKEYKLPITFHVADYKWTLPFKPSASWETLEPITSVTYNVKLDEFLKIISITYQGHDYSVQDIIKTTAHILGGVHSGTAKTEKEKAFLDIDKVLMMNKGATMKSIHSICSVSMLALKPLVDACRCD